jgi:hypothetical protein
LRNRESHETYLDVIYDVCKERRLSLEETNKLLATNTDKLTDEMLIPIVEGIDRMEGLLATQGILFDCEGFEIPAF